MTASQTAPDATALADLLRLPLKPADYLRLARQIDARPGARRHVHILASFSVEFMVPYLKVEAFRLGLLLSVSVGPYGQFEQQVGDTGSALWKQDNDAVVLLPRPEDVDQSLFREPGAHDASERMRAFRSRFVSVARDVRRRARATILVADAAPPSAPLGSPAVAALCHAIKESNLALASEVAGIGDAHVFDWQGTVASFGAARFADARLWYLAKIPCGPEGTVFVARRLARRLAAAFVPRAKCVVVDLDDTLWGGVLGDDGIEGLQLGDDYPGIAFKEVQYRLKELGRAGVLLAIASKNYEETAREAFARHPEMVLKWDDFAAHAVNWNPKADNIREIARKLNIGCDSLVFIDNDELECSLVRQQIPEVHVVCLGRDPLRFEALIGDIAPLDRLTGTAEDAARARMYQQDAARSTLQAAAGTRSEFLTGLRMQATVGACDDSTLTRIAQLIGKTNQFNLTTRRRLPDEVRALAENPSARVLYLRLADIYGDLGLVCVGIVMAGPTLPAVWTIDSFLMSCRVMNRGVEDAFLAFVAQSAAAGGAKRLVGEFIPSAKNQIVRDFYTQRGFAGLPDRGDTKRFDLALEPGVLTWPAQILRQTD